ncbi:amino acid adenylation domain-containing protein [Micromonospora sp. DT227]|uniref:amino acid adenylation domain-containing protein n=1 Tax=Micromonospora sp. DT227 TaxID=3393433 RepID=UPI003CEB12B1
MPTPESAGTVLDMIAEQVATRPDAVAVSWRDERLTYRDLDAAANRLGHRLIAAGVRPDTPVGVGVPASVWLPVALLGILRAGAAYLGVNPAQPPDYRRALLDDAGVRIVVTAGDDSAADGRTAVPVDGDGPDAPTPRRPHPDSTAYVAYTSGSTGRPKGVRIPHRAVTRLVAAPDYVEVTAADTVLHAAPVAFDASTFELWTPLCHGARVAVRPHDAVEPRDLLDVIAHERVTVLWLTAGLFHHMAAGPLDAFGGVRTLLVGGDVIDPAAVNRVLAAVPGLRVVNGYGPTENTTFSLCHPVRTPVDGPAVPIGRPVPGSGGHILDARLRPVPDGETGELYVDGAGLARGYHAQPARTAERFVANPFVAGARMYRTGDLARRRPDGAVDFLGRVDDQVKISGYRVEPGEVEAALRRCPPVRSAAVVAQGAPDGGQRLVAFVAGDPAEPPLSTLSIRRHLAASLPRYAVPAAITVVEDLPLTPHSKVDRTALAAWAGRDRPEVNAEFQPPGTPTEQAVAAVWADVLGLLTVGVHDDFFELGGYSLAGMRITGELEANFGVSLPARTFYENSTVAELARIVDAHLGTGS